MNTTNIIFNKLFSEVEKTELETHKVELNAIKDLQNAIKEGERIIGLQDDGFKWYDKAEKEFKEYLKLHTDAIGIINSSKKQLKKTLDLINESTAKIGNTASELGINPSSIKEYVSGLKMLGELRDNNGALIDLEKKLNNFKP